MRVRVASAGTGKTTSLVLRLLRAVGDGVPLRRIAAVTFTRSAADELRERTGHALRTLRAEGAYLGGAIVLADEHRARYDEAERELGGATMATIHGFLMRALRGLAPALALDPDFTAYGEGEAVADFEEELRALALVARDPRHPLAGDVARLGDGLVSAATAVFATRSSASDPRPADDAAASLARVAAAAYDRWLTRVGAARLAPSEIERFGLRAAESAALAERWVARHPLVLVDEFQDVNPLQGALFEALERAGARIEVVGDPKQAIYGFRAADVEVFRRAARRAEAEDTLEPPLTVTRRHAPRLAAVLNHLTGAWAVAGAGFGPDEAPDVEPAAPDASAPGRVELHWWRDDEAGLAYLRAAEFAGLARRLREIGSEGRPWREMAVVARSHAALSRLETALHAAGVPALVRQGRGFFQRPELRDLWHALRVALDPRGLSLAVVLRGPFAGLAPDDAAAIALAPDPEASLRHRAPAVAERLGRMRAALRSDPAAAVATLAYGPWIDGRPFVALLGTRARDNVDALVVALAERPQSDLERLLDGFDRLARETDAGDVPQSGDGVTLLTVHAAKGLEWPLVAVADAGAKEGGRAAPIALDAADGRLAVRGTAAYEELERARRERAADEAVRALYVALSRARDHLLVSGSQAAGRPGPWLRAFHLAGLGPSAEGGAAAAVARALDVEIVRHPVSEPVAGAPPGPATASPRVAAPWAGRVPRPPAYPPVVSPSWVLLEGEGRAPEPRLRAAWPAPLRGPDGDGEDDDRVPLDPEAGERLAGRGTAVGLLVHDAIARGLGRGAPDELADLAGQEVLFPVPPEERPAVLAEVAGLVAGYWALVDRGDLPVPGGVDEDHPELPFAFEDAGSTWHGVIDRLVRVRGTWWVDDYKTDRRLVAARYHFSLATYVRAVELARGVRPRARLVDLRRRRLLEVADADLRAAWAARVPRQSPAAGPRSGERT